MLTKKSLKILLMFFCVLFASTCTISVPSYAQSQKTASVSKTTKKTKTDKKTITVEVGKKKKITPNTKNAIIKWSSSNKKIATVDKKGNVKGIKAGKCVISAETKDTIYKYNIKIKKATAQKAPENTYSSDKAFFSAFVSLQKKADKNINYSATNTNDIHTNRVIVGGEPDLSGLKNVEILKSIWGDYVIQFNDTVSTQQFIEKERNNKKVTYITEDKILAIDETSSGDRTGSKVGSWGTEYVGADIMADYILEQGKNREIVVAVVDTGVDDKHPFLNNRIKSGGFDIVDDDDDPSDVIHGHGTHVSGTIVDCTPSLAVKVLPIRVLNYEGRGCFAGVGFGIKYAADHGADVINLSLSGSQSDNIDDAVRYAVEKGVVVVASAGNEKMDCSVVSPAHLKECIVASAIDSNGNRAKFTNYGKSVDVAAPGVSILSSVPNGKYEFYDGTSMAAPHVSAAAAMIKMLNPSYSPSDVEKWISQYATDLGVEGRDDVYGYGALNLDNFIPEKITGIEISQLPKKTEYVVEESLNTDGLMIKVKYSKGTEKTIDKGFSCSPTSLTVKGEQKVTVRYQDHECSFNVKVTDNKIKTLEVVSQPDKIEYYKGDTLDTSGLTLVATYQSGKKITVTQGFTCSPMNLENVGAQKITVEYENLTCEYYVTVKENKVKSIAILSEPLKKEYWTDDNLDTTGLSLIAEYINGTNKEITEGFTCSPVRFTTVGEQTVEVSYEGCTCSYTVNVKNSILESISVASLPNKTLYYDGEKLDMKGLTLTGKYSNKSEKTITDGFVCSPDYLELSLMGLGASDYKETQKITVDYNGMTTSFDVTVQANSAVSLSILKQPEKQSYKVGDIIDTNGMLLSVTFANGTKLNIDKGYSVSPQILSAAGTQLITVSYAGCTATFNVTVANSEFSVSFDGNGGISSYSSKKVIYGNLYGDLPIARRDYYTFTGWYTAASGGTQITAGTTVSLSSNQTLYAHWTMNGFGNWSEWSSTPIVGNENREVETRTVVVSYNMGTIVCGNAYGARCWLAYMQSGYTRRAADYTTVFSKAQFDSATHYAQGSYFDYWDGTACDGYIIGPGDALVLPGDYIPYFVWSENYGTEYRYRDRIK